jgi:hypothetical protein
MTDDAPEIILAKAIRKADTRYFFENYSRQAVAAIEALESAGYAIVPKRATREMYDAAKKAIVYGQRKPGEVVGPIWEAMLDAAPGPYQD